MKRVNIIGAGKVGRTFMSLVSLARGTEMIDILSARAQSAASTVANLNTGRAVLKMEQMRPADLWILSVPDDRIAQVAQDLAMASCGRPTASVAMHCSGFLSSDVLAPLRDLGWTVASCHPVLSFADPQVAARRFRGTFCAVEGDATAVESVVDFVTQLHGIPFPVDTVRKPLYHAAAVFSNNFATVLQAIAREAWKEAGVPPDIADQLGNALLSGACENVAQFGPATALTGPAARGDLATLHHQKEAIAAWHPEAAELYDAMSNLALRLKADGSTLPDVSACLQDTPKSRN